MAIQMNHLWVYARSTPDSLHDFIEFWAKRYYYPYEHLYTQNIGGPHTPEGLSDLFKWKIGTQYFASKLPRLKENFIDRHAEAEKLSKEIANREPRENARCFLEHFREGGAIHRIFWLHCWNTRHPIYDQHVHRAMAFIQGNGEREELPKFKPDEQIELYLDRYLSFFDEFRGLDGREVDKALWQFGKSLKDGSLPRIR